MNDTPVSPLITTYVVDIGKAKMSTFTRIRAEHICVEPRTINPSLRFVIASNWIVLVMVYCSVYRLIVIMPIPSNRQVIRRSQDKEAFLLM